MLFAWQFVTEINVEVVMEKIFKFIVLSAFCLCILSARCSAKQKAGNNNPYAFLAYRSRYPSRVSNNNDPDKKIKNETIVLSTRLMIRESSLAKKSLRKPVNANQTKRKSLEKPEKQIVKRA